MKAVPWVGIFLLISLAGNIFLLLKNKFPVLNKNQNSAEQTVTRVIDGDTFDTREGLRVRLYGVDAPEYSEECFSLQAKERLTKLILRKEVNIKELKKDNFNRTVANIYEDGLFINKILVTEGYGRASNTNGEDAVSREILDAQDEAQKAERGIWSAVCKNPAGSDCVIKGNVRSDTKTRIYHTPDCFNYDKISINPREKDQWFCTEEEAQAAGFFKSKDCP